MVVRSEQLLHQRLLRGFSAPVFFLIDLMLRGLGFLESSPNLQELPLEGSAANSVVCGRAKGDISGCMMIAVQFRAVRARTVALCRKSVLAAQSNKSSSDSEAMRFCALG